MEKDKWGVFKRYYYNKHYEFLSNVWFDYQRYTLRNIRERVKMIKKAHYADVESALKIYDIEESTREIILHCKSLFYDPDKCDIFLFVGFFSPDAFVLRYRGDFVICVGLERFHDFQNYEILLSHEYFHYIQNKGGKEQESPIYRLIREGLSVYFSKIAYPGKKENLYFFLNDETFALLRDNDAAIIKRIRESGVNWEDLFSAQSKKFPPRSGYFIGYKIISDFIDHTGDRDLHLLLKEEDRIVAEFQNT